MGGRRCRPMAIRYQGPLAMPDGYRLSPSIPAALPTGSRRSAAMPKSVMIFLAREAREMIPPTLFFAVAFNLIVLTTQLILDDYRLQFLNFMIATTTALVVGKSVLVANALPFLRRFDRAPLIQPVLFKTLIYFLVVFVVRVLEKLVEYLIGQGT